MPLSWQVFGVQPVAHIYLSYDSADRFALEGVERCFPESEIRIGSVYLHVLKQNGGGLPTLYTNIRLPEEEQRRIQEEQWRKTSEQAAKFAE